MPSTPQKPSFQHYFLWGLFWMATCELIHLGLQQTPFYRQLENANLDALLAVSSAPARAEAGGKKVFVVLVTQDDFDNPALFAGVSPLNPKKLAEVVSAVVSSGPLAVGVDFDTSLWEPDSLKSKVLTGKGVPIVWAKAAVPVTDGKDRSRKLEVASGFNDLGGICYGVTAYFPDEDGLIREYQKRLPIRTNELVPSLSFNLAQVSSNGGQCRQTTSGTTPPTEESKPQLIGYHGATAFGHLAAGALLKLAGTPGWRDKNPLHDNVVLVGGSYREARDYYPTPIGYLPGVDILANSVQSQLPGGELTHGPAWNLALGYFEGVVLLIAFYFIPLRWGLLVTLLAGPVYGVVVNWLAFHWHGAFLSFVPSFVGLVIFKCVEYAREHRRLHEENIRLTKELERFAGQHVVSTLSGPA